MNISTAYRQHQQVLSTQAEIAEVKKELKTVNFAYKVAFVGTFALYFCFIWGMYIADLWGFSTWLSDNVSEIAALVVYGVLAIALPLAMALIKEIAYKHFSAYPNSKAIMFLVVGILALAGVLYESITSSSQQQHISHSSAENSKSFEVITASTTTVETGSMASLIAAAQQKVARCEEKLKAGKEKHCEGDKAKLQGYLDAEKRALDSAERAGVKAIEAKTKAMQELKEESFKPVFKAIRDSMSVTIATGIMIVTVFVSVVFEVSHLLLILLGGQKKQRLIGLESNLINLEAGYMDFTGKAFKAEDFSDDSVLNMNDVREQSPSPIGFGIPATSQFKYQEREQENRLFTGFVNTNNQKPSTGDKQSRSTWNAELSKSGINSPMDSAMNQSADQEQISRIVERGQQSLDDTSQLGIPSESSQLDNRLQGVSDSLYPAWRRAVKSGECSHAKAATQKFIWKHGGDEIQTLTANETGRIWNCWKVRGANDGLLRRNPKYAAGNRKPQYVLA